MVWPPHPIKSKRKGISMELQIANSNPIIDLSRCQHRYPSRRRCRLPVSDPRIGLCANHARELQQRELADLSSVLVGQMTKFDTSDDINDVLSRLLILTSQDRVSPAPRSSPISATSSCAAFPAKTISPRKSSSTCPVLSGRTNPKPMRRRLTQLAQADTRCRRRRSRFGNRRARTAFSGSRLVRKLEKAKGSDHI